MHGKKGYISAYSYEGDVVTAYSVMVKFECWFVLPDEVEATNERVDPNRNRTNDVIKIEVAKDGKGQVKKRD